MQYKNGIPIWGDPIDDGAYDQILRCSANADASAMMADHHKGYSVPIGGVLAYKDLVSPSAVGYDIACGNKAVLTDAHLSDIKDDIGKIMDEIWESLEFGMGKRNRSAPDHPLYNSDVWLEEPAKKLKDLARHQLGTIGSGNHYVDILCDEQDRIWVGVHFGSRGLGHKITTFFLRGGGATDGMDAYPLLLDTRGDFGLHYIQCMELAGEYAYAGRDWVCKRVVKLLGAKMLEEVHNHHNYTWREVHGDEEYWVVRKGATPAFPGQRGFVGGSMGDCSVILEGKESHESKKTLYSTVHGAGRVMSRTAARGKINRKTGEVKSPGRVSPEMMAAWLESVGVTLRGGGLDESPHCYKRLPEVLKHHAETVDIKHIMKPLGVAMAGPDTFDPYKD